MRFFLLFCGLFALSYIQPTMAADSIRDACYATTKCGARSALQWMSAVTGAQVGASMGVLVGAPIMSGYAGFVAGNNLGGRLAKKYSADEYLYLDNGQCLECDTHQIGEHYECPNGTIATNGSNVFRCRTQTFKDAWAEIRLAPCPNSPIKSSDVKNSRITIRADIEKTVATGINVYSGDACLYIDCPEGFTQNSSTNSCEPNETSDSNNSNGTANNNTSGGGGGVPNRCEQTRCGGLSGSKYNECVACCHVASSVANWNGNSCVCAQFPDQMKFIPNTNPKTGGVCLKSNDGLSEEDREDALAEISPIELYECDPAKIAQVFTWQTQYANNSQISAQITAILQYCDDIHRTELQFNSMYNQLQILINNANDAAELNQRQTSSRRNIERAMSDIDSIRSTLDQSKWKNADGGFNTSRLLSDSIAGVVLGTAGGLITTVARLLPTGVTSSKSVSNKYIYST